MNNDYLKCGLHLWNEVLAENSNFPSLQEIVSFNKNAWKDDLTTDESFDVLKIMYVIEKIGKLYQSRPLPFNLLKKKIEKLQNVYFPLLPETFTFQDTRLERKHFNKVVEHIWVHGSNRPTRKIEASISDANQPLSWTPASPSPCVLL